MKFNIEVELDYINEDGDLDVAIKDSILAKVTKIVMEKVSKQIDSQLDKIVVNAATKKAKQITNRIASNFMNRKFTKSDRFGDKIETLTVKDMIKREFDKFWKMKVDKDGRESGYGTHQERIKWEIDHTIETHSKLFAQNLTRDTENKIKATMKENLSRAIGAKLVSELGFDKMLMENKS